MKRIWIVVFVLIVIGGISYAGNDPFSNLLTPQYQKIPLIIVYPGNNTQSLIINTCRSYSLPDAWEIQRYDSKRDVCVTTYLGDARRGQQKTMIYGQPVPKGWTVLNVNRQQGIQRIQYVGDSPHQRRAVKFCGVLSSRLRSMTGTPDVERSRDGVSSENLTALPHQRETRDVLADSLQTTG